MSYIKVFIQNILLIKLALFIVLLIQSCSNSSIGNKLSNSFDSPSETLKDQISKEKPSKSRNNPKKSVQIVKKNDLPSEEINQTNSAKTSLSSINKTKKKNLSFKNKTTFKKHPYRIIIILNEANPSSPAEVITSNLLQKGIQFEVEKIERLGNEIQKKRFPSKRSEF